jgi:hypothetical protein
MGSYADDLEKDFSRADSGMGAGIEKGGSTACTLAESSFLSPAFRKLDSPSH